MYWTYVVEALVALGGIVVVSYFSTRVFYQPKRKLMKIFDTMEIFKRNSMCMKNRDLVEEKLSLLLQGGAQKLQVISDFDHTISRVHLNGTGCDTTYGILKNGSFVSEESRNQAQGLFEKYYPIEIDPHLTKAEKIPFMKEWYMKSQNLMIKSGIKRGNIKELVSHSNAALRDGCDTFFRTLLANDVPLLILSAGIGDILTEVLKQKNLMFTNMEIVANFMQFDVDDRILGFKGEMIHTFNKNQSSIENSDYFKKLKTRSNVILLGDSLGDLDMCNGMQDIHCILKIGFLNSKVKQNLPNYMEAFDIVLTDDQTMDIINGVLQIIL